MFVGEHKSWFACGSWKMGCRSPSSGLAVSLLTGTSCYSSTFQSFSSSKTCAQLSGFSNTLIMVETGKGTFSMILKMYHQMEHITVFCTNTFLCVLCSWKPCLLFLKSPLVPSTLLNFSWIITFSVKWFSQLPSVSTFQLLSTWCQYNLLCHSV